MSLTDGVVSNEWSAVNAAFSRQAIHFDSDDLNNPVLRDWRKRIHKHIRPFLKSENSVLELNAGTGIDALHFAQHCRLVLATDLSTGMVREIEKKIIKHQLTNLLCRQLSFTDLQQIGLQKFDFVFSNFGGLNCLRELSKVARPLDNLLAPGGHLTWVVMPRFCPWEFLWLLKGKWRDALRRFRKEGAVANLEGEQFQTYYHSLTDIRKALGPAFELVQCEGLGIFSAPPAAQSFYHEYPGVYRFLRRIDLSIKNYFPFSRWGDHIIVTFRKCPAK